MFGGMFKNQGRHGVLGTHLGNCLVRQPSSMKGAISPGSAVGLD